MREVDYVHMLLERRVEGMVFICAEITDVRGEHSHYGQLLEQGARLVFVNGTSESLPITSVGVDERASGRWRPSTCWSWVIGGSASSPGRPLPSRRVRRTVAAQEALSAAGIDAGPHVAYAGFSVDGGRRALRSIMERAERRPPHRP